MKNRVYKIIFVFFLFFLCVVKAYQSENIIPDKKEQYEKELIQYAKDFGDDPKKYIDKFKTLRRKAIQGNIREVATESLYYQAYCFYFTNKNDSSSIYSQRAIEEAEKYNNDRIKAKAMGLLAMVYSRRGFTHRAFSLLDEAIKEMDQNDHKTKAQLYAQGLQISMYASNHDKEDSYSIQSLREAELSGDKGTLRMAYIGRSRIENYKGNGEQAKKLLRKAMATLNGAEDNYISAHINLGFGEIYHNQKMPDSAILYQLKALKSAMAIGDKKFLADIYNGLKASYKAKNDFENYKIADENAEKLNDSLRVINITEQETVLNSLEKDTRDKQIKEKRKYLIITGISILLLLFFLFILIRYYRRLYKLKLTTREKEKIIQEKQNKINTLEDEIQKDSIDDILRYAKEDQPVFLKKYRELYPDFFKKLETITPELTPDDLKCCAMMHLNFTAKEIAFYTHASIRTVENRKYRIRKKLNLESSVDLNEFLINL
ncbi:ATP-dependent transcriptional regulator [Chryseobacterium nakagawai]|uniref:HTH luxR-type domain-containing protein n=1 Tax=Chryseobacterium nakagawai TaxID=1241982 RepID=A0AAD0YN06_CHRNA|nr:hypothetical protein [Chryseobacterium nakagawai]AZA90773.1 hypothetical protein EG343_09110 [Chryseobacterium nakagawai]VEH22304.1 ATP-dependent transcriptional regulator [Chryseobacterium nakagawai]